MTKMTLVVRDASGSERSISLDQPNFLIGRADHCDLYLADRYIARRHAQIVQQPDGYHLVSLHYPTGVLHNGERLPPLASVRLEHNDEISLGDTRISVTIVSADE